MINLRAYTSTILQAPLVLLTTSMKIIVEISDFLIDHINAPIANLIDAACLNMMEELGSHGSMLAGAALYAYLYNFYVAAVALALPITAPYIVSGFAGLIVLNELVCMKKIYSASSTDKQEQKSNAQATDRLETMRSRPIETALTIAMRLVNTMVNIPAFIPEIYKVSCEIKDKIAAFLLPWKRTTPPLIIPKNTAGLVAKAALGSELPMREFDSNVTEGIIDMSAKPALVFNKDLKVKSVAKDAEDPSQTVENNMPRRRHSFPTYRPSYVLKEI